MAKFSAVTVISTIFFFNDTATTEIYTLSLHDALPIYQVQEARHGRFGIDHSFVHVDVEKVRAAGNLVPRHGQRAFEIVRQDQFRKLGRARSEEHTSELQSRSDLVCRLLLEKKKNIKIIALMIPNAPIERVSRWVI